GPRTRSPPRRRGRRCRRPACRPARRAPAGRARSRRDRALAHALESSRDYTTVTIRVDADRLRDDFDALAAIGTTPDGGVERLALTDADLEARAWFASRAEAAGLETSVDTAGNQSAILPGRSPGAPTLLLGSHLDTVPNGGRFDGALGVLAALEVLRVVNDERLELHVALEAIDFTDGEGTLVGLLGSFAVA